MNSIFDPSFQANDVESKIVVALERLSQVFRINLWRENKKYGLSPIQIQIIIFLNFQNDSKKTVTKLALEFNMTKATISEAVKILEKKQFIQREINPSDGRSYIFQLTEKGIDAAKKLSLFANEFRQHLLVITEEAKETVLKTLLDLIYNLQKSNIISLQRMCYSCHYFIVNNNTDTPFYCQLLDKPMRNSDLRIDCQEHKFKE